MANIKIWLTFYIKVCILCELCYSLHNACRRKHTIALLRPNHIDLTLENNYEKFENMANDLSISKLGVEFVYVNISSTIISQLIEEHKSNFRFPYSIHLGIEDFFKTNYPETSKSFIYSGDAPGYEANNKTYEICRMVLKTKGDINETCELKNTTNPKFVKVVSKQLSEDFPELHELINSFPTKPSESLVPTKYKHTKIIICGNVNTKYLPDNITKHKYTEITAECPDKRHAVEESIAVLAAKPFNFLDAFSDVPTIFYDEISLHEETTDTFVNSFTQFGSTKYLLNGFMKFFKKMKWSRAAIISDNESDSAEFERELSSLFRKENIVYISKTCRESLDCDFKKALASLVKPKIVIANMGEKYAENFSKQFSATKFRDVVCIARGWSYSTTSNVVKDMKTIFSITLGPTIENEMYYKLNNREMHTDLIKSLKIINPFNAVVKTMERRVDPSDKKNFSNEVKKYLHSQTISAYIFRTTSTYNNNPAFIAEIIINQKTFKAEYKKLKNVGHIPDSAPLACALVNNDYYQECMDTDFVLIMLVICVFFITLLAIMCFFDECDMPYSRMP